MEIGEAWTFEPYGALLENGNLGGTTLKAVRRVVVTGEVVYVNEKHRWFRVWYRFPEQKTDLFECFPVKTAAPAVPAERRHMEGFHQAGMAGKPGRPPKRGRYDTIPKIK